MTLTYDILCHIISLSWHAKDAVQLIATCKVLYHEGPKIALKKPVIISTEEQFASFLKFLRADHSTRCRYLRQLELWACTPDPDVVQELIEILPLLTNIEYLRLVEADDVLDLHPALTPAFCSITTLRHINLTGVKGTTCAFLLRLYSPLISANISFISDYDPTLWDYLDDDEWERTHPAILLGNFASTLEELHCVAWWTIPPEESLILEEVYPNMRKLSIELHHIPLRIDPFIRAFQNLTDLHVSTEYHGGRYSEDMRGSHDANIVQQLNPVNSCGTWAHLEHFRGSLFDLYIIGLTFHIRRVTIVDRLDDGPRTDMLAAVLRDARPLHLKLEGITGTMLGDSNRGFISMLRDAGLSSLLNLDVCIYFGEDDQDKDLSAVIDNLVSALAGLPLKFLELRFETSDLDPTPEGPSVIQHMVSQQRGVPVPPAPAPAPLSPAELSLKNLDMDALMARLGSMPSLEVAHVVLPSSRDGGDCGWKGHDQTITKGTSRPAGREQWESWIPGKNRFVL